MSQPTGTTRLLDVARACGVSLRTASRVLNGDPRVAQATRQRVQAAMLELHFQPDEMAGPLRAGTDTASGSWWSRSPTVLRRGIDAV